MAFYFVLLVEIWYFKSKMSWVLLRYNKSQFCFSELYYCPSFIRIQDISFELSKHYGLTPDVQTEDMFNKGEATYEVVKISSLGGVMWVANRVDELESPRYFKSYNSMMEWKGGMIDE